MAKTDKAENKELKVEFDNQVQKLKDHRDENK